jgi:hypothetical protein
MGISVQQCSSLREEGEQIISQHSLWQDWPDQSSDHGRNPHSDDYAEKGIDDRLRWDWLLRIESDKGADGDQYYLHPEVNTGNSGGHEAEGKENEEQCRIHHGVVCEKGRDE